MAKNARLDHQETSRMSIWSRSIVKLVYYSARCGLSGCSTDFTEGHSTTNIRTNFHPIYTFVYNHSSTWSIHVDRSMTRTVTVFSIFFFFFFNNWNRKKRRRKKIPGKIPSFFIKNDFWIFKFNWRYKIADRFVVRHCKFVMNYSKYIELIWFFNNAGFN